MRKFSNKISEDGLHLFVPVILEKLSQQDCSSGCFIPTGGIAFELITDNNFILKSDTLRFTKDLDVGFYSQNKINIKEKVIYFLDKFKQNRIHFVSLAVLINNMLIEAEEQDPRLESCRISINDIDTIKQIPFEDLLKLSERSSKLNPIQVFSIVLKIKELKIQLLECGDEFHKLEGITKLPNGLTCITRPSLLHEINNDLIPDKTRLGQSDKLEKYKLRAEILEKSKDDIPMLNMETIDFTFYNTKVVNKLLSESTSIIDENSSQSIKYYSGSGYSNINEYLLLKHLFDDSLDESKYENIKTHIDSISKMIKIPKTEQTEDLILYRFTRPSIYDKKVINNYMIGDIIRFPTFTSTTYDPIEGVIKHSDIFTDKFSPMVIFKIIVKPSNYSNLLFIESYGVKDQHEVLILYNTLFKLIDKKFVLVDFNGIKVQKLLITLELSKDLNKEYEYTQLVNNEILKPIPNISQYISLPEPQNTFYDINLKYIYDKFSNEDDKNYKSDKTIVLKNKVISLLSDAISNADKEKKDDIQKITNIIKEHENERSNNNKRYKYEIDNDKKNIELLQNKLKNNEFTLQDEINKLNRKHNELVNDYNNKLKEKFKKYENDKEQLNKEMIESEKNIKMINDKEIADIETTLSNLLNSKKTYQTQMDDNITTYSDEIKKIKKELDDVENDIKMAKPDLLNDLQELKKAYENSLTFYEKTIKEEKANIMKYIERIDKDIEINNKKIQDLKNKLSDKIDHSNKQFIKDIERIDSYIKNDENNNKHMIDVSNIELQNSISYLKQSIEQKNKNYEKDISILESDIALKEKLIKENNEFYESMINNQRKYNSSYIDSKLKMYARLLNILNKISIYGLNDIVKYFEKNGGFESKTMIMYDVEKSILSYAAPYLLRNNKGYKLKNNIGSFTHIDYSIKLFDSNNVLKLEYPKINKTVIYQNILNNPNIYYNLEYIRNRLELKQKRNKDVFQQIKPKLPILAAGIGILQSNPLIVIIIIVIIVMTYMLFKTLIKKSDYSIPKKSKNQ